ncbi:hypothetical protein GCM10027521_42570 [Amycolatopsis cihanbeyliensis]
MIGGMIAPGQWGDAHPRTRPDHKRRSEVERTIDRLRNLAVTHSKTSGTSAAVRHTMLPTKVV